MHNLENIPIEIFKGFLQKNSIEKFKKADFTYLQKKPNMEHCKNILKEYKFI